MTPPRLAHAFVSTSELERTTAFFWPLQNCSYGPCVLPEAVLALRWARQTAARAVASDRILGYIRSVSRRRDIVSITQLKNDAAALVREVSEGGRTLVVTQNGAARVVLMDVGEFERMQDALMLLKLIALGEADAAAGRVASVDEAFDAALDALDG